MNAIVAALAALAIGLHPLPTAPQEDEPGWYCVEDGNRICGPDNANGVAPGCYDEGGVMVAPWPCSVVVNPDGSSDVYTPGVPHLGTGNPPGPGPGEYVPGTNPLEVMTG